MLGQVRRTTRTDVGLALTMTGISYLMWALVVGVARHTANELSRTACIQKAMAPTLTSWFRGAFLNGAAIWDVLGVLWLLVGLVLIMGSSRQAWIISWPWLCGMSQSMAAVLLALWTVNAARSVVESPVTHFQPPTSPTTGWTSFWISLALALVLWVLTLVWLLYERARLRRWPSHRDTRRTHVPG